MISGPLRSAAAQEPEPEHRSQRDPAESPIKDPGALRGSAWLTLQTRHAGRPGQGTSRQRRKAAHHRPPRLRLPAARHLAGRPDGRSLCRVVAGQGGSGARSGCGGPGCIGGNRRRAFHGIRGAGDRRRCTCATHAGQAPIRQPLRLPGRTSRRGGASPAQPSRRNIVHSPTKTDTPAVWSDCVVWTDADSSGQVHQDQSGTFGTCCSWPTMQYVPAAMAAAG